MPAATRPLALRAPVPDASTGGIPPRRPRNVVREWREALGAYVRELRLARGLSGTELAHAVGLTNRQSISYIENGEQSVPPERIGAFANALKIPTADFARVVLRYSNPWLYAHLFGADEALQWELESVGERVAAYDRNKRQARAAKQDK